jgi:hypothetical protein
MEIQRIKGNRYVSIQPSAISSQQEAKKREVYLATFPHQHLTECGNILI